jgi:hypothetical protein
VWLAVLEETVAAGLVVAQERLVQQELQTEEGAVVGLVMRSQGPTAALGL